MGKLMLGAQAPSTDSEPPPLSIREHCSSTNIGKPPPSGVTLGVAYIVPKLGCFST